MFRTEVHIPTAHTNFTHQEKVVTIGSCFAEVIGHKLRQHKVEALVNPFGTIFNPVSVCRLLGAAVSQAYTFGQRLVQHQGIWYAYDLHSSLSSPDKEELLEKIRERLAATRQQLQQASLLIITLGTAVAYELRSSGEVVANCHKLPASQFNRRLLTEAEMAAAFEETYTLLQCINPGLKMLLTVSPVRHIRETIPVNSVSKALLRVLCHQLTEAHEAVLYFPAYEIMLDDLRDYRFYKQDMLHPIETAEDYIWQKFAEAYYDQNFRQFILEWEKLRRALAHRPFHPASQAHQAFLRNTLQQVQQLGAKYKLDVSEEEKVLQQQLLLP